MIQTFNVSLPKQLTERVDRLIQQDGYSSRSELVRSALRLFLKLSQKKQPVEFTAFKPQPLSEIRNQLERTGLYSNEFIDSVISGLAESSLYAKPAPKAKT